MSYVISLQQIEDAFKCPSCTFGEGLSLYPIGDYL